MSRLSHSLWACLPLAAMFLAAGCAKENAAPGDAPAATATDDAETKLSAEDQALVDAQKICPVGKQELGSMGTPIKVMLGDRPVFVCCEGCREPLLAEPDKYLANLTAAEAEAPTAGEAPAEGEAAPGA